MNTTDFEYCKKHRKRGGKKLEDALVIVTPDYWKIQLVVQ